MIRQMATVPIQFVLHQGPTRQQIQLFCHPDEQIGAVKGRLAERIGADPELLRVIFCGRALPDRMALSQLALGPTTQISVLTTLPSLPPSAVVSSASLLPAVQQPIQSKNEKENEVGDQEDQWIKIDAQGGEEELTVETEKEYPSDPPPADIGQFSTFHVFCKQCMRLQRAKLRAHCGHCDGLAIIFKQEPQKWEDVAERNGIRVHCHTCDAEQGARFRFKCIECNEIAAPLQHIRRSSPSSDCVVCGPCSASALGVRLPGCAHFTCLPCFTAYGDHLLARMGLIWHPQAGYTLGCPVYGCQAFVLDMHTLYLLGISAYQRYQQMAAQMYFSAQIAERQHCPRRNCGAAFFVEETDDGDDDQRGGKEKNMLLCPECSRLFCRRCCAADGTCKCAEMFQSPDDSATLIGRTTKGCPQCAAPIERAGGCAHIHCTQCQTEWCFICRRVWSDDCQWDHWFD